MLVFKDRSVHHIFALERISKFTICSPHSQEENDVAHKGLELGLVHGPPYRWRPAQSPCLQAKAVRQLYFCGSGSDFFKPSLHQFFVVVNHGRTLGKFKEPHHSGWPKFRLEEL
jgi:hypothetical protein